MTAETDFTLRAIVARVAVVRRRLVLLAVLKLLALALLFAVVYVTLYAWLDHRFHLGVVGRIVALSLLVAGLACLLYRLARALVGHISYRNAANYIEQKHSFDQQLVTAIEYHENKKDYPYSKTLAEYLVQQVDMAGRQVSLENTVPRWQINSLLLVTILGILGAGLFLANNYAFFSRYFTRLIQPTAVIAPIPATQLVAVTKDITAEPKATVKLIAEIHGSVPDEGRLVVNYRDANNVADDNPGPIEPVILWPIGTQVGQPRLQTELTLPIGRYQYRFEAARSATDWHDIRICRIPKIETIVAKVTPRATRWVAPYTETISDFSLQTPQSARVTLTIKATEPLQEVKITTMDGKSTTTALDGKDRFSVNFVAEKDGFVRFELLSSQKVANDKVPPLQVMVKADAPAEFTLVSPDGDYLATNVASVPVSFEVTDDFGLDWVALYWEVAGAKPEFVHMPVEKGSRKATISKTFEIEDFDLDVGDTILIYAKARDVNTSGRGERSAATSDIYFIEIKPYRQLWIQSAAGLPNQAKQGLTGDLAKMHDKLISVLEYTRAILKKTWVLANQEELTEDEKAKLEAINKDAEYAAKQLTLIRNDKRYRFGDGDREIIDTILADYAAAGRELTRHRAKPAVPPEKKAYVTLRKFVQELWRGFPPPGNGPPQETPDKVALNDQVHMTRYEKERIDWELKKLADKLAAIDAKQKQLKQAFEHFLKEQRKKKQQAQDTTDEKSWTDPNEPKPQIMPRPPGDIPGAMAKTVGDADVTVQGAQKPQGEPDPNKDQGKGKGKDKDKRKHRDTCKADGECKECKAEAEAEAQGKGKGKGQGQGQGQGQGRGRGQGQGQGQGHDSGQGVGSSERASGQERLRMLTARQKAVVAEIKALQERLAQLPVVGPDRDESQRSRRNVQGHLTKAMDKMDEFDKLVRDSFYAPKDDAELMARAGDKLDEATEQLDLARQGLQSQVKRTDGEQQADDAERIAKELMALADELDESVTPADKARMLAALEAAKNLLEQIAPYEVTLTDDEETGSNQANPTPGQPSGVPGGEQTSGRYTGPENAETARYLARKFWSISVKAKKRSSTVIEDDPSDAKYRQQENQFFEKAAAYEQDR